MWGRCLVEWYSLACSPVGVAVLGLIVCINMLFVVNFLFDDTFSFYLHTIYVLRNTLNVFPPSLFLFFVCIQEAKEQLSPLSAALEKLQQEKQELVERKRQKQEEGQEKVDTFSPFVSKTQI